MESSGMSIISWSQQLSNLDAQLACLESSALTINPQDIGRSQLSSLSNQPARLQLLSGASIGVDRSSSPMNSELSSSGFEKSVSDAPLAIHGNSYTGRYDMFAAHRQRVDVMLPPDAESASPHPLGRVSQHGLKSTQTSEREPWPKIIRLGGQSLGSTKGTTKQDHSSKSQISASSNTPQKSLSKNKRVSKVDVPSKVFDGSFESVRSKMRESLAASLALVCQEDIKNQAERGGPPCDSQTEREFLREGTVMQGVEKVDNVNQVQQNFVPLEDDASFEENVMKDDLLRENGLCWASFPDPEEQEAEENRESKRARLDQVTVIEPVVEKPHNLATKIEEELFRLFGGVNKKYKEKGRSLIFNLKDPHNPDLRKQVCYGEIAPERLCLMTAEELASKELSEWRIAKAEELAQMVVLPDSDVDLRRVVKKTHKGEFQVEVEQDDSVSVEVALGASSFTLTESKIGKNAEKDFAKSRPKKPKVSVRPINDFQSGMLVSAENNLGDHVFPNSLTDLSHENLDLMQDLMVDEFKDPTLLPPIPSLDEFMKELDSEPPFENLPVDFESASPFSNEKDVHNLEVEVYTTPDGSAVELDKVMDNSVSALASVVDKSEVQLNPSTENSEMKVAKTLTNLLSKLDNVNDSKDYTGATSKGSDEMDSKGSMDVGILKQKSDPIPSSFHVSKNGYIWDGLIQLNVTSLVTVLGFYKSGEQISTRDWSGFLEIKGRVRLDAFEKFLQDLSLSRTRAIMVMHFLWKIGSPESGRLKLCETIESYILDERVGFAEAAPGVEIYFCPPHSKTTQILAKHLSKEHEGPIKSADNGFIGLVLSRRLQVAPMELPRPLHHKNTSKNDCNVRKPQCPETNLTTNLHPAPPEEMDDVPPGFGPAAPREEDDLPEFSFVQNNTPMPAPNSEPAHLPTSQSSTPVDHLRQLIQKYGQEGAREDQGMTLEPWDDDDDDIPDWQPDQRNSTLSPRLNQRFASQQKIITPPRLLPPHIPEPMVRSGWQSSDWHGGDRGSSRTRRSSGSVLNSRRQQSYGRGAAGYPKSSKGWRSDMHR